MTCLFICAYNAYNAKIKLNELKYNIMNIAEIENILTPDALLEIFPASTSDEFFDALFGDASEGSYDIELGFCSATEEVLTLELKLHERPGCCLACNLTHGLPEVFSRHPLINVKGVVEKVDALLGEGTRCGEWTLGSTQQQSRSLHTIPLRIALS